MILMSFTLLTFHSLMSPLKEAYANIDPIFVTALTFQPLISPLKEDKRNSALISVTLLTFHPLMSPLTTVLTGLPLSKYPINICLMLVTPERLGTSVALMVRLVHPAKALSMEIHTWSPHCSMVRNCRAEVLFSKK